MGTSENNSLNLNALVEGRGMNYLHLAVESQAKEIISYLLFDLKANPNELTATEESSLHLAVRRESSEIIELLLLFEGIDIDRQSPSLGTPLHLACAQGSIKIAPQLLLNNANPLARNAKNKLPKELTKNQRIVYLLEKYEKMVN
mmetsp:Transcript_20981/g.20097  ORF Transcript_20981/g.20097 Transcript_20981/m.20097 type:complete len:145 (+) Transcript_20981:453-887(+)